MLILEEESTFPLLSVYNCCGSTYHRSSLFMINTPISKGCKEGVHMLECLPATWED